MTQRISILLLFGVLATTLAGCDLDDECAPHKVATFNAPDNRHVAERWVSICGAPGSTVTDIVSVTNRSVARPPRQGTFAFNEDDGQTSRDQILVAWIDSRNLRISVDSVGDVRDSPVQMGDVAVTYTLGPDLDLNVLDVQRSRKLDERRQWERLKTSAAWKYVEADYDFDAYLIQHYQKFADWARAHAAR